MSGERTATKDQVRQQAPQRAQEVAVIEAPRLPYDPSAGQYQIGLGEWQTLINAVFPSAKTTRGIMLGLAYCAKRNLDIFKKPIHIVPMRTMKMVDGKKIFIEIETIWPGITEVRITAHRTGEYGGNDEPKLGPIIKRAFELPSYGSDNDDHPNAPPSENKKEKPTPKMITLEFPEWAQYTVYRWVEKAKVFRAFVGPRVQWLEAYATNSKNSDCPNEMWRDRAEGQLLKCAEAAALRAAFPEELGGEYIIDEAHKFVDVTPGVNVGQADDAPATRPEKPSERPARAVTDTPAARAARARQQATTVDPEPSTNPAEVTTESVDPSTGEIKPSSDEGPPEMSEALEDALAKLARIHDPAEIDGARPYLKKDLTPDDFAVWQRASLEAQQRLSKQKR